MYRRNTRIAIRQLYDLIREDILKKGEKEDISYHYVYTQIQELRRTGLVEKTPAGIRINPIIYEEILSFCASHRYIEKKLREANGQ